MCVAPPARRECALYLCGLSPNCCAAWRRLLVTRAADTQEGTPRLSVNTAAGIETGRFPLARSSTNAPNTGHSVGCPERASTRVVGAPLWFVLEPRSRIHTADAVLGSVVGTPAALVAVIFSALSANHRNLVVVVAMISDRRNTKKKARHRTPHNA
ncbi:hypothetical protein PF001_g24738 [Phytophthora fragariae]|uniref:Uncharacterized protein n=1 Tax=Phytophthora fragariae TaxID=53985 RepID=A0A6A4BVE6_9STRA|nr:hypothetical protein PF001_g24738 [Phytophthora fragariae]